MVWGPAVQNLEAVPRTVEEAETGEAKVLIEAARLILPVAGLWPWKDRRLALLPEQPNRNSVPNLPRALVVLTPLQLAEEEAVQTADYLDFFRLAPRHIARAE